MNINEYSSSESQALTYFMLMQKVGDQGCYQWIIYAMTVLNWFLSSTFTYSLTFLFLQPGFDCTVLNVPEINCQDYVCSHLDKQER